MLSEFLYYLVGILAVVGGILLLERLVAGPHTTSGTGYARVDSAFDLDRLRGNQYIPRATNLLGRHGRSNLPLLQDITHDYWHPRDVGEDRRRASHTHAGQQDRERPGHLQFDDPNHLSGLYPEGYRAVIGALTMKGELLDRGAVEAEFRTAADLFDRIGGGAGPGSLKAVAPAGREPVIITVPAGVDEVSLLGETLDAVTPAGHETAVMPGRPVAIVSNLLFEYRPAPVKR